MIARTPLTWRLGAEGRHPRREHEAVLDKPLLGAEIQEAIILLWAVGPVGGNHH